MSRIVGYTYKADTHCPEHIEEQLPTGKGEDFDGWAVSVPVVMTPEENLDEIAQAFGFDREDETTFDSDDFPKRIYAEQVSEYDDNECWECGKPLVES